MVIGVSLLPSSPLEAVRSSLSRQLIKTASRSALYGLLHKSVFPELDCLKSTARPHRLHSTAGNRHQVCAGFPLWKKLGCCTRSDGRYLSFQCHQEPGKDHKDTSERILASPSVSLSQWTAPRLALWQEQRVALDDFKAHPLDILDQQQPHLDLHMQDPHSSVTLHPRLWQPLNLATAAM